MRLVPCNGYWESFNIVPGVDYSEDSPLLKLKEDFPLIVFSPVLKVYQPPKKLENLENSEETKYFTVYATLTLKNTPNHIAYPMNFLFPEYTTGAELCHLIPLLFQMNKIGGEGTVVGNEITYEDLIPELKFYKGDLYNARRMCRNRLSLSNSKNSVGDLVNEEGLMWFRMEWHGKVASETRTLKIND